ncbi:MAG: carbon-nitrogen hydrolase family protein [SAR202 cluster bacterium]|nr:carbon-nitrogen hydrolase family protein [SAR202 cluster bacterium]
MSKPRSIAVAQTCPVRGDVDANLAEHLRLIPIAASEGARVVVFPELSLTGYEMDIAAGLAFTERDPRLAPLAAAAASHDVSVLVGAPVRIGTKLYIGALILEPGGATRLYTKHHLGAFGDSARVDGTVPPAEATVFHAGDRNPLLDIGGNPAAVAVCADIGYPEHARNAAAMGAKNYLASTFVIRSDFAGDSAKLRRYAVEHRMTVALANFGSPSGGLIAAGRSSIWSDTGDLLVQLEPTGSGVAIARETPKGWQAKAVMVESLQVATPRA